MMRIFVGLLISMLFSGFVIFAQSENPQLKQLVQTEISFAKMAGEKGTKAAFLEFLDEKGIVFEPSPMNGKEIWQKRAESPSLLAWQPKYADISSDGGLGYTIGDWQYSAKKGLAPTAFGTYFTIWRKPSNGSWKFVLDFGITHDKPAVSETGWKAASSSPKPTTFLNAQKLFDLETAFDKSAQMNGITKAYNEYLTDDSRLLRDKKLPVIGKKAILAEIAKWSETITWSPTKSLTSSTLGYTYGEYTVSNPKTKTVENGYYVHLWKWDGQNWRVVLDVAKSAKE